MRPADSAAPVLAEVIANSARLRRWRWLSATSTSTRRAPRPGATIRARAGRGRRPSAAAGWAARGSCRCAAGTEASCPSIWLRGSIRWPAISPSGFSPGRSCHSGSVASPPAALTDAERAELHELFCDQREQLDQALEILERVGYGRPRGRRPRTERAYGQRRGERLDGLVGKLPRALAKRLPTSADTHRSGNNDGQDIYGPVSCSQTLRSGHLGILAAAGGRAVALAQPRRAAVRRDDRGRARAADHRPPAPGRQGHRRDPPSLHRA
jgi:hypothetical protein